MLDRCQLLPQQIIFRIYHYNYSTACDKVATCRRKKTRSKTRKIALYRWRKRVLLRWRIRPKRGCSRFSAIYSSVQWKRVYSRFFAIDKFLEIECEYASIVHSVFMRDNNTYLDIINLKKCTCNFVVCTVSFNKKYSINV